MYFNIHFIKNIPIKLTIDKNQYNLLKENKTILYAL